jgi:hypothetical protein
MRPFDYHPAMLFEISGQELSDAEVAATLRDLIAGAERYRAYGSAR